MSRRLQVKVKDECIVCLGRYGYYLEKEDTVHQQQVSTQLSLYGHIDHVCLPRPGGQLHRINFGTPDEHGPGPQ